MSCSTFWRSWTAGCRGDGRERGEGPVHHHAHPVKPHLRTVANFATNLAALVIYIPQGAVMWEAGLLMGLGNLTGSHIGARTAVRQGAGFIPIEFVVVVGAFIGKIGIDVIGQFTWLPRSPDRHTST